jgi:RNA polymerase sigma-70 factor (ECF subfamily)
VPQPRARRRRPPARTQGRHLGQPLHQRSALLDETDASSDVLLAESVSMAMLVLLETIGPDERAVFVRR